VLKLYVAAKTQIENIKDRFVRDEDGASLIEYSVLVGLITVGSVLAIGTMATWVNQQWTDLHTNVTAG
jgi:pilus assembly protein Flp/PilA